MRQHRIYTQQPLNIGNELTLEEHAARHLIQVLRLKNGADIVLFNGSGNEYDATLTNASKRCVQAQVKTLRQVESAAKLDIHLGIGISKGERMDFAIQKSVELGVNTVTPLFTKRCVVRLSGDRLNNRMNHWRKIIISACEQSNRCYVPNLNNAISLTHWLEQETHDEGFILDHRASKSLHQQTQPKAGIRLLVGPEGGLSSDERDEAILATFNPVRLGPRVMRTETAPLAAIAAIQTLWGDFDSC